MFVASVLLFLVASVYGEFIAGGFTDVDVTQDIRNAAIFATDSINAENKQVGSKWHTLARINNPSQQVVNGMKYRMDIILKESDCRNHEINNGASIIDCPPIDNGVTKKCFIEVWHQARRNPEYTLEKDMCIEI